MEPYVHTQAVQMANNANEALVSIAADATVEEAIALSARAICAELRLLTTVCDHPGHLEEAYEYLSPAMQQLLAGLKEKSSRAEGG